MHFAFHSAVLATLVFALPAMARPAFQAPFPCGQVWTGTTYGKPVTDKNHAPDSDSLDFATWRNGSNVARDLPVLASAAGTISIHRNAGGGLRYLMIEHEDNWRTHYLHIADENGLKLEEGRKVAAGEMIARTSDSGANSVHIHYTQVRDTTLAGSALDTADFWDRLRDGDAVRVTFDGVKAATHEGDQSTWGKWGKSDAETFLSNNCPGAAFATWREGTSPFFLRYRPETGWVRVSRMDAADGTDNVLTAEKNLGLGWAHFVPFTGGASGTRHVMGYSLTTGQTKFWELGAAGDQITEVSEVTIHPGWTHMTVVEIGGEDHLISYDSRMGHFNVDRWAPALNGFIAARKTNVGTGYTHIVPYSEGSQRYLLLYRASDGKMRIIRLEPGPGGTVEVPTLWTGLRKTGWTHIVPLRKGSREMMLGYRTDTGAAKLWEVKSGGGGLDGLADLDWSKRYSTLTPVAVPAGNQILVQKIHDGRTRMLRLNQSADGFDILMTKTWARGWR